MKWDELAIGRRIAGFRVDTIYINEYNDAIIIKLSDKESRRCCELKISAYVFKGEPYLECEVYEVG